MQPPRILVADDDEATRELLRLVLEEEGYRVATAPDGALALEEARRCEPALILLDMKMPRVDGAAFARAYRRWAARPAPIVCMTAAARPDEACAALGPAAVLAKPFELDRLLAVAAAHACPRAVTSASGP